MQTRGFTSIEMLLCLSIILITTTLSLQFVEVSNNDFDFVLQIIEDNIDEVQGYAIVNHQKKTIEFKGNQINALKNYKLPNHYYFARSKTFTYHPNGNISKAGTVELCDLKKCRSIILSLETGVHYVK